MNKRERLKQEARMLANAELMAEETLAKKSLPENIVEKELSKWRSGVWQYLMDHSRINEVGNMVVSFYVRDQQNFWWRVNARATGQYSRVKTEEMIDRQIYIKARAKEKGWAERVDVAEQEILRQGTIQDKLMLWLYKKSVEYIKNYK